jgi:polysaccharide export outer membrane protein
VTQYGGALPGYLFGHASLSQGLSMLLCSPAQTLQLFHLKCEVSMSKFSTALTWLTVLMVTAALPAAAQMATPPTNSAPTTTQVNGLPDSGNVDHNRPTLQHRNGRYQIMRDDVIAVSFPLSPELNQTVTVQPDGYVTLQSAGSVYLQGMTVPETAEAIKKAYEKILHDPIIDVDLKDFQKPWFMISGQVGKPGRYELRQDTTVSEAIAVAGGFLPTAKTQVFLYHRISTGWVEVKKLSLKELLNGKNISEDVEMQPGDMIFVPEKFITNFRKYVPYTLGLYLNPALSNL